MIRVYSAAFLTLALTSSTTYAQDGPLNRVGRALDNTGKNIRARVETEVARGQISAQERDVVNRVARRIEWDKQLVTSTMQVEGQPGGTVVLRGSVINQAAKSRAIDLVQNTVGVTRVIDELVLTKDVKVIQAKPAPGVRVIEVPVAAEVITPAEVVTPVVIPAEPKAVVTP